MWKLEKHNFAKNKSIEENEFIIRNKFRLKRLYIYYNFRRRKWTNVVSTLYAGLWARFLEARLFLRESKTTKKKAKDPYLLAWGPSFHTICTRSKVSGFLWNLMDVWKILFPTVRPKVVRNLFKKKKKKVLWTSFVICWKPNVVNVSWRIQALDWAPL